MNMLDLELGFARHLLSIQSFQEHIANEDVLPIEKGH